MLFEESDFAIYAHCGDERNNNTWDEEFVTARIVASCIGPLVEGVIERPSVVGNSATSTANVARVSRAGRLAVGFWLGKTSIGIDIDDIPAVYEMLVT